MTNGLDPGEIDNVTSQNVSQFYNTLKEKKDGMNAQYRKYLGIDTPDAIRFKAEYKVYADMLKHIDGVKAENKKNSDKNADLRSKAQDKKKRLEEMRNKASS